MKHCDNTLSILEVSMKYDISRNTLKKRCLKFGFTPRNHNGSFEYRLTSDQIDKLIQPKIKHLPEIIYINTTWEIYESKINYLKL